MVMCQKGCLCLRSLKTSSVAAGMFSLMTSLVEVLTWVSVFTGYIEKIPVINPLMSSLPEFEDERLIAILYLALTAANVVVMLFSVILLFGIEPKRPSRSYFLPWIIYCPLVVVYESAINIHFFNKAFTAKNNGTEFISNAYGHLIVPLIYWIGKTLALVVFWFIVIFYSIEVEKKSKTSQRLDESNDSQSTSGSDLDRWTQQPPPQQQQQQQIGRNMTLMIPNAPYPFYGVTRDPLSGYIGYAPPPASRRPYTAAVPPSRLPSAPSAGAYDRPPFGRFAASAGEGYAQLPSYFPVTSGGFGGGGSNAVGQYKYQVPQVY
jgi:uncharacterized protein with PQ loop repeat